MTIATGSQILAVDALGLASGHVTIFPWAYNSQSGSWTWGLHANQAMQGWFFVASPIDGDSLTFKVALPPGTYTLRLLVSTTSTSGVLDVDVDGVEKATFDLYDAGLSYNVLKTQTGIVVAAPGGVIDLVLRIDGKNGSSAGFAALITAISLWRTS